MAKVLVVDDEPDIEFLARQKFRKEIASGAFELLFAQNGQEALDLIKKEPDIAVVVSDVNMPEMDGLTLLDRLKDISPVTKTIVVSAYGDTKTLRTAMNKGAFDFVTKPIDFKELSESITRALSEYKAASSPLYTYQLILAAAFPPRIDLNYPPSENNLLWDAFFINPVEMYLVGVTCLPSTIPMEIAVSISHGLLKSNPNLSIEAFEEKLTHINSDLKAHVLIGHYHLENHVCSFKTNGVFKAGKTILVPYQTALHDLEDVITLQYEGSSSHISLSRI